jgi:hypothetical protein
MGDISSQMGFTVLAMDATANWDGIVEKYGDDFIIVYPQSTGDPFARMVSSCCPAAHMGDTNIRINPLGRFAR